MTSWPTSQLPPTSAPDPHIGPRWAFGARFSPHVLVLLATVYVTWGPASRALVTGVFWWWADSYRQVELVMEDAQPNAGSPYIDGRVEGLDGVVRLVGVMQDGVIAPRAAPFAVFAPGKRLPIWHSDLAPNFVVEGVEVNDVPVSSRPTVPRSGGQVFRAGRSRRTRRGTREAIAVSNRPAVGPSGTGARERFTSKPA